jgi:uncharacterized protein YegL
MCELFNAREFTVANAKPMPIMLLLDASYSMTDDSKISTLNSAVKKMLATLKKEESQASEFLISIISFGGNSGRLELQPTNASNVNFNDLVADGMTPLGSALKIAKDLVEDKNQTPSRAYRPLIVLVSDGYPNDEWEKPFQEFVELGRSAKCDRMAMAIGDDADMVMLNKFVAGTGHDVFAANQAEEIHGFFKFVTMSVTARKNSQNPNVVPNDATLTPPAPVSPAPQNNAQSAQPIPVPIVEPIAAEPQFSLDDDDEGYW